MKGGKYELRNGTVNHLDRSAFRGLSRMAVLSHLGILSLRRRRIANPDLVCPVANGADLMKLWWLYLLLPVIAAVILLLAKVR